MHLPSPAATPHLVGAIHQSSTCGENEVRKSVESAIRPRFVRDSFQRLIGGGASVARWHTCGGTTHAERSAQWPALAKMPVSRDLERMARFEPSRLVRSSRAIVVERSGHAP